MLEVSVEWVEPDWACTKLLIIRAVKHLHPAQPLISTQGDACILSTFPSLLTSGMQPLQNYPPHISLSPILNFLSAQDFRAPKWLPLNSMRPGYSGRVCRHLHPVPGPTLGLPSLLPKTCSVGQRRHSLLPIPEGWLPGTAKLLPPVVRCLVVAVQHQCESP